MGIRLIPADMKAFKQDATDDNNNDDHDYVLLNRLQFKVSTEKNQKSKMNEREEVRKINLIEHHIYKCIQK